MITSTFIAFGIVLIGLSIIGFVGASKSLAKHQGKKKIKRSKDQGMTL